MRTIYITGGGKCGTHIVGAYLHANWPGSEAHPSEFKNWRTELPALLTDRSKLIFHCPGPDIPRFRAICPGGTVLLCVRNPVQQYLSWLCGFGTSALTNWSMRDPRLGDIAEAAMSRVLDGFRATPEADIVWRLEDFASDFATRDRMVSDLLGAEARHEDASVTVSKSQFGWRDGVQAITGREYPALLTEAEVERLSLPAVEQYYPNWRDQLLMRDRPDSARLIARTRFVLRLGRRLLLRKAVARNSLPSPFAFTPTWLLARYLVRSSDPASHR